MVDPKRGQESSEKRIQSVYAIFYSSIDANLHIITGMEIKVQLATEPALSAIQMLKTNGLLIFPRPVFSLFHSPQTASYIIDRAASAHPSQTNCSRSEI